MISSDVGTIKNNYPKNFSTFYDPYNEKELYVNIKKEIKKINNWEKVDYNDIQKHCINNFIWGKSLKVLLDKFN